MADPDVVSVAGADVPTVEAAIAEHLATAFTSDPTRHYYRLPTAVVDVLDSDYVDEAGLEDLSTFDVDVFAQGPRQEDVAGTWRLLWHRGSSEIAGRG